MVIPIEIWHYRTGGGGSGVEKRRNKGERKREEATNGPTRKSPIER